MKEIINFSESLKKYDATDNPIPTMKSLIGPSRFFFVD